MPVRSKKASVFTGADPVFCERRTALVKSTRLILVFVVFLAGVGGAAGSRAEAEGGPGVSIQVTFDYGTLVEYVITSEENGHNLSMVFSRRRKSEGSEEIAESYLKYRFEYSTDRQMVPTDEQTSFITHTMKALHERFGSDLKLRSLSAHEYLGNKEAERKAILAFYDYSDWQRYLKNNSAYTQWEIYGIVLQRWRETGVFSDLIDTFKGLGYACQVSGFEKLFTYQANDRPLFSELKGLGVEPDHRIPYPGVVHFELKRMELGKGSDK